MMAPAKVELARHDRVVLARAVEQFNRGLFFACHETLEEVWRRAPRPTRSFLQALIQVSVGFHHLERGNSVGALRTFGKALARMEPYPVLYLGIDVASERDRLHELCRVLEAGEKPDSGRAPAWRLDDPADRGETGFPPERRSSS